MSEIKIAVDAMGGDNAPQAIVEGCINALRNDKDISILLAGPAEQLEKLLKGASDVRGRIEILPADEVIDMHESPMLAIRRKVNSSMVQAMLAVKDGRAQAVVSAGSTGAVLAGGMFRIGRIPGIDRPALAPVIPGKGKPFLLIDSGANVDCQSAYLEQFGLMGSVYMQKVLGIEKPSVMLANIGAEKEKGSRMYKEAHERMAQQTAYQFDGNIEARDIPNGVADVVVADGFDGNLILKYTEGIVTALFSMIKAEMTSNLRSKIGALLLKPAFKVIKKRMSSEEYGGAPLLGVNGAVVKAHGSSNAKAIQSAIRQAKTMVEGDVVGLIQKGLGGLMQEKQTEEK